MKDEIILKNVDFINHINFDELNKHNILKEVETSFWPGHTIVTYPFYEDLKKDSSFFELHSALMNSQVKEVNLYIHIPYCTDICSFCAYSKSAKIGFDRQKQYIKAIEIEIQRWIALFNTDLQLDSVYFGGGTPTALPNDLLNHIIRNVKTNFSWPPTIESTCEVSPETIIDNFGLEKLVSLKENGINRISIGIQSFDDKVTQISGRRHNSDEAIQAIDQIKSVNFKNVNIDLMYGLPNQTLESWIKTLQMAVLLDVQSITLYPLKVKYKSKWIKVSRDNPDFFLNLTDNLLLFANLAKLFLESEGYKQYNVHWFIKEDKAGFNQQKEKYSMKNLLGLGCSTYSFIDGIQFFNIYNELRYVESQFNSENLPFEIGRKLSKKELMTRYIIFGLKKGIDVLNFRKTFNCDIFEYFPIMTRLIQLNLILIELDTLNFSDLGKLFADEIGVAIHESINSTVLAKEG